MFIGKFTKSDTLDVSTRKKLYLKTGHLPSRENLVHKNETGKLVQKLTITKTLHMKRATIWVRGC